jgi:hypothetical protein
MAAARAERAKKRAGALDQHDNEQDDGNDSQDEDGMLRRSARTRHRVQRFDPERLDHPNEDRHRVRTFTNDIIVHIV